MPTHAAFISKIYRAVCFIWHSAPGWTVASMALLVVQGILPLLGLYLMKLVVDAVVANLSAPDPEVAFGQVAFFVALLGILALVGALCSSLTRLVSEAQAQVVTDHMHDILHAKSIQVDLEYYENSQYYDTLHRAQQEAPLRPRQVVNDLLQVALSGISFLAMMGLLLAFHWAVMPILFATAMPGVLVRVRYANNLYSWQRKQTPAERLAWYLNWMLTRDTHAKEIRLFGLGSLFTYRFREVRKRLRQERLAIVTRRSIAELVTEAGAICVIAGLFAFIAFRALQGVITLGDLVMYYQAVQRGQGFLGQLLRGLSGLYEDSLFLSNLYEFLDLQPTVTEPVHPRPVPRPLHTGIRFDHVSFQYPHGTKKVCDDLTLTIRPGEHVAFVGKNGVGKTTLIKLLCRLYDPTQGGISLDGRDLRTFDIAALRREISVIFQDYAQYQLTARENIWFGNIKRPPDQDRIVTAACQAGADEIIMGLKQGYETTLGKWFGEGEELSIGEWQKVALARAFLRDAQILILDEPASALDAKAEYEVFKRFHQLAADRTVLLISHRLSTVKMVDCIYVLEEGRIVEHGTHAELVHRGGTYAHLFETQAQYYR